MLQYDVCGEWYNSECLCCKSSFGRGEMDYGNVSNVFVLLNSFLVLKDFCSMKSWFVATTEKRSGIQGE